MVFFFFKFKHAPGRQATYIQLCLRPEAGGVVVDHYISTLYAHIIQRFDVPTDRPARDLPLNHNESMNEPLNQFGEPNETESETETKRTERQRQLRNESVKFILKLKQKKQQQQQKDRVLFYVFVQNAQRAAPRPAPRRHP